MRYWYKFLKWLANPILRQLEQQLIDTKDSYQNDLTRLKALKEKGLEVEKEALREKCKRYQLTIWDLKLSQVGALGLKQSSISTRLGMYEATEIIRLTYQDEHMREAAKEIQKLLMDFSRTKNNLLPHETTKKETKETKESKLLPRFDI